MFQYKGDAETNSIQLNRYQIQVQPRPSQQLSQLVTLKQLNVIKYTLQPNLLQKNYDISLAPVSFPTVLEERDEHCFHNWRMNKLRNDSDPGHTSLQGSGQLLVES